MDQQHRDQALKMATSLRLMMFDTHLMRYQMHSHFHPLVGSQLSHIADICMSAAVKIEEDLENNPETIVVDALKWPSRVHEFLSEKGEDIYRTPDEYFTPERMVEYTNWLIDRASHREQPQSGVDQFMRLIQEYIADEGLTFLPGEEEFTLDQLLDISRWYATKRARSIPQPTTPIIEDE